MNKKFEYDKKNKWFEGVTTILGKEIEVSVICGKREFSKIEEAVNKFISNIDVYAQGALEYASKELTNLETKWSEGEHIYTTDELREKFTIDEVSIYVDKVGIHYEILFDDGDVFYGHGIAVTMDKDLNYTDADLFG